MIRISWDGHYLDGKTADRQAVQIHLAGDGLKIIKDNGETLSWPYGEIRQVQGFYQNEPVRLERGAGIPEALVVADPAFLSSLHEFAPETAKRFHNPAFRSRRLRLTIYAAICIVAIGSCFYLWGIPLAASLIAPHIPLAWEKGLGQSALKILAPEETRCKDPELNEAVTGIVSRLTAQAKTQDFKVIIAKSPSFNAFALPGGNIVLFSGLLKQTRSPEELAGVLAHEMQHIIKRHATKRIIEDSSSGIIITALSGDASAAMVYGVKIAHNLAQLRYSRQDEEEADREGMKIILSAGVDPKSMIRFFEIIKEKQEWPEIFKSLSTHPDMDERIARLGDIVHEAEKEGITYKKLLPGVDWERLKKKCR